MVKLNDGRKYIAHPIALYDKEVGSYGARRAVSQGR
jgi:hypothetical protein